MPNGIYTPGQSNAYVDRSTNQPMPYFVPRPGYPGSQGPLRQGMSNLYGYPETRVDRRIPSPRLNRRSQYGGKGEVWGIYDSGPNRRRYGVRNRPGSQHMSLRQLNRRRANRMRRGLPPLV